MAHKVNLDALIARDDFEITSEEESFAPVFCLPELEARKNTFNILRKPEFQRATSDWTPTQVVEIVKNFVDGDLIPAVIIWNSPSRLQFIMDGAHRLSALIAWVNDDYGFGTISQKFYGVEGISAAQREAHFTTKDIMKLELGSYQDLLKISSEDGVGTAEERRRATGMNSRPIQIQSYSRPDPRKAEISFYRINQGGTPLNGEEREIIRTRRWPESIAARALWRVGQGKQYWSAFAADKRKEIEHLAADTHALLLKPEFDSKVSPMQIPLVGMGSSNASMGVLDQFILLANNLPERERRNPSVEPLESSDPKIDSTGDTTIKYLQGGMRLAETLASKRPFSFGLHPAVYAYSKACKFLPGAFFAETMLVKDIIKRDKAHWFTDHRCEFEEFLVANKHHLSVLTHDGGSKMKSAPHILAYWQKVLDVISSGSDPLDALKHDARYAKLVESGEPIPEQISTKISKTASHAMALKSVLQAAARCPECGARIYKDAWTHGHEINASEGGSGHSDNLKMTHPFCNSGYKTRLESQAKKAEQRLEASQSEPIQGSFL